MTILSIRRRTVTARLPEPECGACGCLHSPAVDCPAVYADDVPASLSPATLAAIDALATTPGPVLAACIPAAQTYLWARRGIGMGPACDVPAVDALSAIVESYPGGLVSFAAHVLAPPVDTEDARCSWCTRAHHGSPNDVPNDRACRLHAAIYWGPGMTL